MPVFLGDLSNWLYFRDLSVAAVHNNGALRDAQTLQYWKGQINDEPSLLLQFVAVTDAN
jgi:hypothetical protein